MKEQRTKNNIGLIGLAVMVSLVFYYLVSADSQNNRGNKTNKSHESSVSIEPLTPPTDVSDETSPSMDDTAMSMSAGPAIDYGSLESILAAYQQESADLLQAYQQYEGDMDAMESRAKISYWRQVCYFPVLFDSQEDLDRHLMSRPLSEISSPRHKAAMRILGECDSLRNYLGREEMTSQDYLKFLSDEILEPNSEGETHPILTFDIGTEAGGLISYDEAAVGFTKAYAYSVDHPEYLESVFSMAESYLNQAASYPFDADLKKKYEEAFKLLRWRYRSKSLTDATSMSREEANQGALEVFQLNNHPQEFDEIIGLADEIENSVGQGDWSWLNALDNTN